MTHPILWSSAIPNAEIFQARVRAAAATEREKSATELSDFVGGGSELLTTQVQGTTITLYDSNAIKPADDALIRNLRELVSMNCRQDPTNDRRPIVTLSTKIPKYSVSLDGNPVEVVNGSFRVPADTPFELEIKAEGFMTQKQKYGSLPAFSRAEFYINGTPGLSPPFPKGQKSGTLTLTTYPSSELAIYLGNTLVFKGQSPMVSQQVPAGTLRVHAENRLLGAQQDFEVNVAADKETNFEYKFRLAH
jgi:hypothetical protein